jgi:hypothetical protein
MDSDKLCSILNSDPYNFYYTSASISNTSDKNMYNIKIHIKENNKIKVPYRPEDMNDDTCMEMQKQGQVDESFECMDKQTLKFIKNSHDSDIFKKYITSPNEVESILAKTKTITYEISSLGAGKSLFLLLNAYSPNNEGLPKEYLHSFSEIQKI